MTKKSIAVVVLVLFLGISLAAGQTAEAMNNESAALLAGGIAVFGPPILNAISGGFYYGGGYPPPYYRPYYNPYRGPAYGYGWFGWYEGGHDRHRHREHVYKRGWHGPERRDHREGRDHRWRDNRRWR